MSVHLDKFISIDFYDIYKTLNNFIIFILLKLNSIIFPVMKITYVNIFLHTNDQINNNHFNEF